MMRMRRHERGIVAVVVAIAMLVLLLMAGFAIDIGHLALNKSRLQSTVDASALAAAKVLSDSQSLEAADLAAREMFDLNAAKHSELDAVLDGEDITVQFSRTLKPFVPGSTPADYVRVIARPFSMWTSFTVLIGLDEMVTRASAVAGPVSSCELWPVAVCAVAATTGPDWGYAPYGHEKNTVTVLKLTSKGEPQIGPGNFQFIALPESIGGRDLRTDLARGVSCVDLGGQVLTEPGNKVMARAGVNARFYPTSRKRQLTYLPDLVGWPNDQATLPLASADGKTVTHSDGGGTKTVTSIGDVAYSYANYLADYAANRYQYPYPQGRAHRRVVTVPVIRAGQCGDTGGRKPVDIVGYQKYLLLQPVCEPSYCSGGAEGWIFAQYLGPGDVSGPGQYGPYRIVLHNDPDSPDS